GLTVWVSPIGAPHLVDPARLVSSARRLFPNFDELWGPVTPVPEANVRLAEGDVLGWDAFPTPGHASHHGSYVRDGTLPATAAAGEEAERCSAVFSFAMSYLGLKRYCEKRAG